MVKKTQFDDTISTSSDAVISKGLHKKKFKKFKIQSTSIKN